MELGYPRLSANDTPGQISVELTSCRWRCMPRSIESSARSANNKKVNLKMTLIERAKQHIGEGKHDELLSLLADCVNARDGDGLLAMKLLAGNQFESDPTNFQRRGPAAYCLLAWGQAGLKALVENALEEPNSKNTTMAFHLLATIAEGREPQSISWWVSDDHLRESVSSAVGEWVNLAAAARSHLRELMLSMESDQFAAIYAGSALFRLAVQDDGAIRNLIPALALRSIAVGPKVIAAYNELVAGTGDDESIFQSFLEKNPLMLDPRAFQVWSQPDFHGKFRPDFVIRTYDNNYVIVEIETPAKLLVTRQNQLSADATHAISQVLQYREYLRTHLAAASEAFPGFTPPSGLVIIGDESSLDAGQQAALRAENQTRPDIRIIGFDTLSKTANAVTSNVIHGIPGVIMGKRLP